MFHFINEKELENANWLLSFFLLTVLFILSLVLHIDFDIEVVIGLACLPVVYLLG